MLNHDEFRRWRAGALTTESVRAGVWVVVDAGLFAEPVPGDR